MKSCDLRNEDDLTSNSVPQSYFFSIFATTTHIKYEWRCGQLRPLQGILKSGRAVTGGLKKASLL